MLMKKWVRRTAVTLLVLFVVFITAVYFLAPNIILYPRRLKSEKTPADVQLPYERLTVSGQDSVPIEGYWVGRGDSTRRTTIILLHGIGNNKESWLGTAAWLWKEGFSTVMIDLRAHGCSGGNYCSYGQCEKNDVAAVTEYLLARDSSLKVGVWGHSLGGAVALQSLACEPRLAFGVVESTFADFRSTVYDYQWRMFKIASHTFADDAIARAAEQAHFIPDSIKPFEAAEHITQPVFMGHGDQDEKISIEYGRKNFAHLASTDKQFYVVQGGHHSDISAAGGEAYRNAILSFLKRQRKL